MRVLGIDPGSRVTGWGVIEANGRKTVHVDNGGIAPKQGLPFAKKLKFIYEGILDLIEQYKPDVAAIEDVFVAKNVRSSLILGHARGTAMVAVSSADIEILEYTPTEVKKAIVGTGRASKEQIQKMVQVLLSLPESAFEDASDALAVAICHLNSSKLNMRIKDAIK